MSSAPSFAALLDLASEKFGGRALSASDEFFAGKENLLKADAAIFIPGKYTDFGKWMDGWESRRKRNLGPGNDHDWCIIALGAPGEIHGVTVDTSHFTGNFPESCAVDGAPSKEGAWTEIVPQTRLQGNSLNYIATAKPSRFSHVRLRIYPDGGVARFRVHGVAVPDWGAVPREDGLVDLAAAAHGAVVTACNDMHFGHRDNLIFPGRASVMGEGWETRRKRGIGPGNDRDWIVIRLAAAGRAKKVEVDTNHFKGNFPESCLLEGATSENGPWKEILARTKLQGHHRHFFSGELKSTTEAFAFVRLSIFPDGGISRLRVWGEKA
jgi:allantoicase